MKNNRGSGRTWDMVVPTGVGPVVGGTPVVLANGMVLIPMDSGVDGDFISWLLADELVTLPAFSGAGTAFTVGDVLFWEDDGGTMKVIAEPTSGPPTFIGRAISDKTDAGTSAIVQFGGFVASLFNSDFDTDLIDDPGAGGSIDFGGGGHCPMTSVGVETRSVVAPFEVGTRGSLTLDVDGGNVTVTFAVPVNQLGNNTAVFADVGDSLVWETIQQAGAERFLVIHNEGAVVLSTV